MWGEYGSKDFRCTERRHRKTGRELHHSTESQ
ncbi:prophage tail fiber, partial [Escherichia coli EC1856]